MLGGGLLLGKALLLEGNMCRPTAEEACKGGRMTRRGSVGQVLGAAMTGSAAPLKGELNLALHVVGG